MSLKSWRKDLDLWYTLKWYARKWLSPRQWKWRQADNKKWKAKPAIGETICDCRYRHLKVVGIDADNPDDLILEDGTIASWMNCCDPIDNCVHTRGEIKH